MRDAAADAVTGAHKKIVFLGGYTTWEHISGLRTSAGEEAPQPPEPGVRRVKGINKNLLHLGGLARSGLSTSDSAL